MKIIEAMKKIKANKTKIADLQERISKNCANLSIETPVYGDETKQKISEWLQSCVDLSKENTRLLCALQYTNLVTPVTIEIGDKMVTKMISEWVWRRREYASLDQLTWAKLSDRGLKEQFYNDTLGQQKQVTIVRFYDPIERDKMVDMYKSEISTIDANLEIVNAVTDIIEDYELKK